MVIDSDENYVLEVPLKLCRNTPPLKTRLTVFLESVKPLCSCGCYLLTHFQQEQVCMREIKCGILTPLINHVSELCMQIILHSSWEPDISRVFHLSLKQTPRNQKYCRLTRLTDSSWQPLMRLIEKKSSGPKPAFCKKRKVFHYSWDYQCQLLILRAYDF